MGNSPVDRNTSYMREVWGTTSLTTDYWSLPKNSPQDTPVELKEVLNDEAKQLMGLRNRCFQKNHLMIQFQIVTNHYR